MFTFKVYTINDSTLIWTYKLNSEDEAWERLSTSKKISVQELKKIFKIEKYAN